MSFPTWIKQTGSKLKAYGALAAIRLWFNLKFAKIGVMTKLVINAESKVIHVELDLKGEPTPIAVDIEGYQLQQRDGKTTLTLEKIHTSREWMNVVLDLYLQKREFPVPDIVKVAL
jgi:hypothetical protein